MRPGLVACILGCAIGIAAADEPTKAPAPTDASATTPPAAAAPARPTGAEASPEATQSAADAQMDHHLRAEGYTVQVRNGEKVYCKRVDAIGSRLSAGMQCASAVELTLRERQVQDDQQKRQLQSTQPMR